MARPLSDSDRRILRVLQKSGRIANVELAEQVGMSPSPCLRRVKQLEADGVIAGYAALIDRKVLGLGVEAFVEVTIERHKDVDARAFAEGVLRLPEVASCYMMAGATDFLLRVVVADLEEFGRFTLDRLLKIPGVKDVRSSFAIEVVKDTPTVPPEMI